MAVLTRDDFFAKIHDHMGNVSSDEDISFLEDMTDTYNDLESRSKGSSEDYERRLKELDNSWREKYKHRFFNGGDRAIPSGNNYPDPENDPKTITVNDLFE